MRCEPCVPPTPTYPQVKLHAPGIGYQALGNLVAATLALTPLAHRLLRRRDPERASATAEELLAAALGAAAGGPEAAAMVTLSLVVRACLTWLFFFQLSVAERTYKQVGR